MVKPELLAQLDRSHYVRVDFTRLKVYTWNGATTINVFDLSGRPLDCTMIGTHENRAKIEEVITVIETRMKEDH